MCKICAKFVPRILGDEQKERPVGESKEMVKLITTTPRVIESLVTKVGSTIMILMPRDNVAN